MKKELILFGLILFIVVFTYINASMIAPHPRCNVKGEIKSISYVPAYNEPCSTDIGGCPTDIEINHPNRYKIALVVSDTKYIDGSNDFGKCEETYTIGKVVNITVDKETLKNLDLKERQKIKTIVDYMYIQSIGLDKENNGAVACTMEYMPVCCVTNGIISEESNKCACEQGKNGLVLINGDCKGTCGNSICDDGEAIKGIKGCPEDCIKNTDVNTNIESKTTPDSVCGNGICENERCEAVGCGDFDEKDSCPKDCGQLVGNDKDSHGCIPSAGYSWCEEKQKCIRSWEESCTVNKDGNDIDYSCNSISDCQYTCGKGCVNSIWVKIYKDTCVNIRAGICSCVNNLCYTDGKEPKIEDSNDINEDDDKVKILPETASERAKERLGELGFNITLKEVLGPNKRVVYEATAEKQGKMFGIFKVKAKVSAEINAYTGEVLKVKKPWWGFLAGI